MTRSSSVPDVLARLQPLQNALCDGQLLLLLLRQPLLLKPLQALYVVLSPLHILGSELPAGSPICANSQPPDLSSIPGMQI